MANVPDKDIGHWSKPDHLHRAPLRYRGRIRHVLRSRVGRLQRRSRNAIGAGLSPGFDAGIRIAALTIVVAIGLDLVIGIAGAFGAFCGLESVDFDAVLADAIGAGLSPGFDAGIRIGALTIIVAIGLDLVIGVAGAFGAFCGLESVDFDAVLADAIGAGLSPGFDAGIRIGALTIVVAIGLDLVVGVAGAFGAFCGLESVDFNAVFADAIGAGLSPGFDAGIRIGALTIIVAIGLDLVIGIAGAFGAFCGLDSVDFNAILANAVGAGLSPGFDAGIRIGALTIVVAIGLDLVIGIAGTFGAFCSLESVDFDAVSQTRLVRV